MTDIFFKIFFRYFNKEQRSYDGGRTKPDLVAFMNDPDNPALSQPPPAPKPEDMWNGHEGAEHIKHLSTQDFMTVVNSQEHALVLFYAPWY